MTVVKTPGAEIFKKVLNGHIVVAIDDFKYQGLIAIPDTAKRHPTKGRVIAMAEDIEEIKIGDTVLYSQFAGYPLQFQGATVMRVISNTEVIAILEADAPEIEA